MSEHDVTVTSFEWPQYRTGPDGTTYWVDSAGQVFSAALHGGPEDDPLGVDNAGRWVPRQKARRGRPRRTAQELAQAPIVPASVPRHVPDAVWVVWAVLDGQVETYGAYADPVEALNTLLDLPGGRVSRALVQ